MKYLIALFLFLALATSVSAQNLGGIGAQLLLDTAGGHTMPRIMSLVPGSPADSNLKATDFIYKVNDVSTKDKTIEDVVGMIRGEVGTTVKIVVTDTKDGKRPRTYNLTRRGIQGVPSQPAPAADPVDAFREWCEKQVQVLAGTRHEIIKTFSSGCGNRYFNFEAGPRTYHIMVMTLDEKTAGQVFTTTVRVFDNEDEAGAVTLSASTGKPLGNHQIAQIEGEATFKKDCIGVVNVNVSGNTAGCLGMYVVVYR